MQLEEFRYGYWPEGRFEHPSQFLSLKERDRRWDKIREEMKKLGLDCLLLYDGPLGNMLSGAARYITNCQAFNDGWVLFPIEGQPVLFPWRDTIKDFAERVIWPGIDIIVAGPGVQTWAVANQVKDRGYERRTIGIGGLSDYSIMEGWLPYTSYTNLQRFLPEAKFENATTMMTDIKAIKSEEEIKLIEKASEIGDRAIETMVMYAKPGIMEHELWARVMYTIISLGGDTGWMGSAHLMTAADWHYQGYSVQQHHMIRNGDVILTEFFPRYAGYVSHPQQPVFVGKVHEDYERCHEVLSVSIKEGIKAMTPEHTWMDVAEAFARPVREAGMWATPLAVHGIGVTMPDPPLLPAPGAERTKVDVKYPGASPELVAELEFLWKKNIEYLNRKVQPNMVLAVQPKACIGDRGLHMGPTVVTTEGYPRLLTRYGRELIRV